MKRQINSALFQRIASNKNKKVFLAFFYAKSHNNILLLPFNGGGLCTNTT